MNFMKQFLTNKGFKDNKDITRVHRNKLKADEKQLTQLFNNDYICIAGKKQRYHVKNLGVNFENTDVQSIRDRTVAIELTRVNLKLTYSKSQSNTAYDGGKNKPLVCP